MKDKFFSVLKDQYPGISDENSHLISENLISPFHITLPKSILEQGQKVVSKLYSLREDPSYQRDVLTSSPEASKHDPKNKSICMSYDFHIDSSQNLKLIEINTNAAFLLLGLHLYETKNLKLPIPDFSTKEIIDNIKEECQLSGNSSPKSIIITDSQPSEQRLYIEFLAFNNLFKKSGFQSDIVDIRDLKTPPDFVYNRHTDFYFKEPQSTLLREWFTKGQSTISPNPHEYALLADKKCLNLWSQNIPKYHLEQIEHNLLKSFQLEKQITPELWSQRKNLFFKPLQSFGSKMSYRGESISKKLLDQLLQQEEILAQEYCPPPTCNFKINGEEVELKYDLRFYAYKNRVQLVIARLYQGQVTNLKARYGGFACVEFIS
jgi:hypothetical protein